MNRAVYALAVLFLINMMNFFDRTIFGAIGEAIRKEWGLGYAKIGALGTSFTLLYALVGVPFGRLADRYPPTRIVAAAFVVWTFLTPAPFLAPDSVPLFDSPP